MRTAIQATKIEPIHGDHRRTDTGDRPELPVFINLEPPAKLPDQERDIDV